MLTMSDRLFCGRPVELATLLAAREARVVRRLEVFQSRWETAVSLTVPMPGPVKDSPATRFLRDTALEALTQLCRERGWGRETVRLMDGLAGPDALVLVRADARTVKEATIFLEEDHKWGRLWDIDVFDPVQGAVSRRALGRETRRCFVCDEPAHFCARSKAHPLEELLAAMKGMMTDACGCRLRA